MNLDLSNIITIFISHQYHSTYSLFTNNYSLPPNAKQYYQQRINDKEEKTSTNIVQLQNEIISTKENMNNKTKLKLNIRHSLLLNGIG